MNKVRKKIPLGPSMSKEKVFHDSYLDVDSREQDYWEWFEKMYNEHPTLEEMQAWSNEREKVRAEVLERQLKLHLLKEMDMQAFRLAYKIAEENKK